MRTVGKYLLFAAFCLSGLFLTAQNLFVVEKPGTIRNIKYERGSEIKLKVHSTDTIISGRITVINDHSIIVNYANEVMVGDISAIYKKRWGYSFLQYLSIFAGLSYLGISAINGLINSDSPVIPEETLIISGSMVIFGIALTPLTTRKIKVDNTHWRAIILDFTD